MARVRNIEWSDVDESERNLGEERRIRNVRVSEYQEHIENEEESSEESSEEERNKRFQGFDADNPENSPHPNAGPARDQNSEPSFVLVRAVRSRRTATLSAWIVCQQYPGMLFTHEFAMEIMRLCARPPDDQNSGELHGDQADGSEASDLNRSANFGNSAQYEAPSSSSRLPGFQHSGVNQGGVTLGTRSEAPVLTDDNQLTGIGFKALSTVLSLSNRSPKVERSDGLQISQALGTESAVLASQNQPTICGSSTQGSDVISQNRSDAQYCKRLQGDSTPLEEAPMPDVRDRVNFDDNLQSEVSSSSSRLLDFQRLGKTRSDPTAVRNQPKPIVQNQAAKIGSKAKPELSSSPKRLVNAQSSGGLQDDKISTAKAPVLPGQNPVTNLDNSQPAPCSSSRRVSRKRSQTAGEEVPKKAKEMKVTPRKVSKVGLTKQNPQPPKARNIDSKPPRPKKVVKQSQYGTSQMQGKPMRNSNSSCKGGEKPFNFSNRKVVAKSKRKPNLRTADATQKKGSSASSSLSSRPAGEPSNSGDLQSSNITRKLKPQPKIFSKNRPAGEFPNLFASLRQDSSPDDSLASRQVGVSNVGAESLHSLQGSASYEREEFSLDCPVPGTSTRNSGTSSDAERTSSNDYLEETSSDHLGREPTIDRQRDVKHDSWHGHLEETLTDQVVPGSPKWTFGRSRSSEHSSGGEQPEETDHLNPDPSSRNSSSPRNADVLAECDDIIYLCAIPPLWLEGATTPLFLARAQPPSFHRAPGGALTSPHECRYHQECAVSDSGMDSERSAHPLRHQHEQQTSHFEPAPSRRESNRPTGDDEPRGAGRPSKGDVGNADSHFDRPRGAGRPENSDPAPCMADANRSRGNAGLGERNPDLSRRNSGNAKVATGRRRSCPELLRHDLNRVRSRSRLVESDPGPSRLNPDTRYAWGMGHSDPESSRPNPNNRDAWGLGQSDPESSRPNPNNRDAWGMGQSDPESSRPNPNSREGMGHNDPGSSRQDSHRPRGIGELTGRDIEIFLCPEASLRLAASTGVLDTVFWVPIDKEKWVALLHRHGMYVDGAFFGCEPKQKSPHAGVRRKVRIKRKRRYRSSRAPGGVSSSSSLDSDSAARSRRRQRNRPRRKRSRPEPKDSSRSPSTSPEQR